MSFSLCHVSTCTILSRLKNFCTLFYTRPIPKYLFSTMSTSSILQKDLQTSLTALQRSREIIRTNAPLLLQWPWENGIALEHGSMRQRLETTLQDSPHDPRLVEMVTVSIVSLPTFCTLTRLFLCRSSLMLSINTTRRNRFSTRTGHSFGDSWEELDLPTFTLSRRMFSQS
jgi:hypothetical protein